ncbi:MAG: hypothetical protein ABL893_14250 [Hyphomicrobium sp.]|nr:hypothetical protein [Hyphomicrobium sp.]
MQTATANGQFAIQSDAPARRHALAPILLGLAAPMLFFLIVDPRAATNASVILNVYMIALFIIATAAYLISVFETGEVTSVTIDKPAKTVIVERTGMLAKSATAYEFADIATVRVETHYDDDGYKTLMPVLVLTTRELVELPEGTSEADVAAMRALLNKSS